MMTTLSKQKIAYFRQIETLINLKNRIEQKRDAAVEVVNQQREELSVAAQTSEISLQEIDILMEEISDRYGAIINSIECRIGELIKD